MKKILLCAAMAMLALVGCEKAVQSELNFEDVKDFATVTGKLVGYVNTPGEATVKQALAGVRVYVEVPNDEYRTGAEGNRLFEGKTDEEGNYSIKVALGTKGITAGKALLKWDDFHMEIAGRTVYFQFGEKNLGALNKDDFREDEITVPQDAVLNATVGTVKCIKGRVSYDAGAYKKEDGSWVENGNIQTKAGAVVIASVKYFEGEVDEVVKKFVAKTDASGNFAFEGENAIPVEANGNEIKLSFEQFAGSKKVFNALQNAYEDKDFFFSLALPVLVAAKAQANNTYIKDLAADTEEQVTEDQKDIIAFAVKGKLYQQAEEAQKDKDGNLTGYAMGKAATTMKVNILVELYDDLHADVQSSILYEGISASEDTKEFSQKVQLFEKWKLSNVKVSVFAQSTKKVGASSDLGGYSHKYYKADSDYKFPDKPDDMSTQWVSGIYKGTKENIIQSKWASDDQLYFDLKFDEDVIIPFSAEDKAAVLGRMKPTLGVAAADAEHTEAIYVGGDKSANLKYFKKSDVYQADIKKDGDKTFLVAMGGTAGLWD